MVERALRIFAEQNFGKNEEYYPIYQGATREIQVLALMAKGERNVLLRPFKKNKLTILAELAAYVEESKREELQDALSRKVGKEESLELKNDGDDEDGDEDDDDDDDDDDYEPRSDIDAGFEVEGVASATIKINRELGKLELGKIDREYIRDAELRAILASTELDINIFKPYIDRKLRLITSVVYSEHFKLKGRRRLEVEGRAGVTIPIDAFLAKLKGHLKKVVIPPKLAERNNRGPVLFKCCRVVFNKQTNKLELPEGEDVGIAVHRDLEDYEAEEHKNTTVGLKEDEESDLADFFSDEYEDSKKLERIKTSVLKPSKDRAERKVRINKYLSWFEKALTQKQKTLLLEEPLNDDDCTFLRSIFLSATPDQRTVDMTKFEVEKIQGYAVIFKLLAGLSDTDWNEVEKAWAE